jgi:hypothetical protein
MEVVSYVCITFLFRLARGWSSDKTPSLLHKHRILSSTPHKPTQHALVFASFFTVSYISSSLIHFSLLCLFSRITDDGYILYSSTTASKILPACSNDFFLLNTFNFTECDPAIPPWMRITCHNKMPHKFTTSLQIKWIRTPNILPEDHRGIPQCIQAYAWTIPELRHVGFALAWTSQGTTQE